MSYLGLVAYCWGQEQQDRLLTECLKPAMEEWRSSGLTRRFWFDRFDARGPHVLGLLTTTPEARAVGPSAP